MLDKHPRPCQYAEDGKHRFPKWKNRHIGRPESLMFDYSYCNNPGDDPIHTGTHLCLRVIFYDFFGRVVGYANDSNLVPQKK